MFPTFAELLSAYLLPRVRALLAPVLERLDELEILIMARADDLVSRLNVATNELASDLRDLRDQLEAAIAGADSAVAEAVTGVLDRFESPIATLEAMGADQADPVPDVPAPDGSADNPPLSEEPGELESSPTDV